MAGGDDGSGGGTAALRRRPRNVAERRRSQAIGDVDEVGKELLTSLNSLPEPRAADLRSLRLLVALDALLVAGSVSAAARRLGLSVAATSRLLGQIREVIGDPILIRSGRQMIPSPRAEALRHRLRAVAIEADALLSPAFSPAEGTPSRAARLPPVAAEPAPVPPDPAPPVPAAPPAIREPGEPAARLARHLAVLSRPGGHARPLTASEAEDAFGVILRGEADPMQAGALLMVMNARGETAHELAGLVRAVRHHAGAAPVPPDSTPPLADLDWPAYVGPRARRSPWFLQAAMLVARAGYRVLVHGHGGAGEARSRLEAAARILGIPVCGSVERAAAALQRGNIAVLPLADFSPPLARLLALEPIFGQRSPVNSLVHLVNPLGAPTVLAGQVREGYPELLRDAAALLEVPGLVALGSGSDVAELVPFKPVLAFRLLAGRSDRMVLPTVPEAEDMPRGGLTTLEFWESVWAGSTRDARSRAIVVGTAALALLALGGGGEGEFAACRQEALRLWEGRHQALDPLPGGSERPASDREPGANG